MAEPLKLLSTDFARKRPLTSVDALVADQVASPAKFLSTDRTPVKSSGDNGQNDLGFTCTLCSIQEVLVLTWARSVLEPP